LEFSFDRPKDTINKSSASNAPSSGPTPAAERAPQTVQAVQSGEPIDPSAIQNERLRKAIERNRARQAQASGGVASKVPPQRPTLQTQTSTQEVHQQASFLEKAAPVVEPAQAVEAAAEFVEERPSVQERAHMRESSSRIAQHSESGAMGPRPSTAVVSRRSVAKPDDTEFVPVKRATKKVTSQISYTTSSTRKKAKQIDPTFTNYLVKGAWVFCVIMVLRLIFANGGITDFYSQKDQLNERVTQLTDIKKENMQLVREIERMRNDFGYQKKLVRDNLGFIAQDEFLILFPREN
jgi:cell division protein FtsB